MKPKLRKIIDIQDLEKDEVTLGFTAASELVWHDSHEFSTGFLNHGNDSWYEYTVGGYTDEDTWGFTTPHLDAWLIDTCELNVGETVMIKHWW